MKYFKDTSTHFNLDNKKPFVILFRVFNIFCRGQALFFRTPIARKYFWRDSRTEKDIIHLMIKYVHAVKEELRQFSRPLRGIGAVHFAFR